jgi:hypothetical protein
LWPFSRAKNAASNRKITAKPLKFPGVTATSADPFCAIGEPFNNKSREKAIIISTVPHITRTDPRQAGNAFLKNAGSVYC